MKGAIIILILIFGVNQSVSAQLLDRLGKRVENKIKERVDRKIDKAVDKGLDKVEGRVDNAVKSEKSKSNQNSKDNSNIISSNYDFIPGDELLFYDDFSTTSIGDFPKKWNTNGAGKIVNLNSQTANWLLIPDNVLTFPELKTPLPENFTIEFDLFYPTTTRPPVTFGFTEVSNPVKQTIKGKKIFYFRIPPKGAGLENIGYSTSLYSGREITTEWPANKSAGNVIRVSIAVNGQRIRLYLGTKKLFDLPNGFELNSYRNNFYFRSAELIPKPLDGFYISDVRIAKVSKDLNTLLFVQGKFITSGIHFDSGSDKIKPISYYLLNEIGRLLQQNPTTQFDVIGHTDSDGNIASNEKLSLQRAAAVRDYLILNFNISSNNLIIQGKGSTAPIANNSTVEGKAQNRRVEFIKK